MPQPGPGGPRNPDDSSPVTWQPRRTDYQPSQDDQPHGDHLRPKSTDAGRRLLGHKMIEVSVLLRPHGVMVELIGPAGARPGHDRARAGPGPAPLARLRPASGQGWAAALRVPRSGEGMGVLAGIRRAPLARRLGELIARDPLFAGALAAGGGMRLLAMVAYPGALWFPGDSYVYVGAALRPRPDLSKTTGYSLFLRSLLPFHSFTLVAGLQHLMGLGIAVMIYLLARRAGVPKRWATVATLPVLLDGFEIEDEHMIVAEALFTFLVMLALLAILWRYRDAVADRAGRGPAGGLRGRCAQCGPAAADPVPRLPGLPRDQAGLEELARLAGGGDARRGLRGARAGLRGVVSLLERPVHADQIRRLLPVGTGVVLRRMLGDQAARGRAEHLSFRLPVQPYAAGRLHLARAAGARHSGRPGERRERPPAARLRHPRGRGPAVRLREVGAEGPRADR